MNIPRFIYPFAFWKMLFLVWDYYEQRHYEHLCTIFVREYTFFFLGLRLFYFICKIHVFHILRPLKLGCIFQSMVFYNLSQESGGCEVVGVTYRCIRSVRVSAAWKEILETGAESTPLTARNQLLFQVLAIFLESESKKISSA